MYKMCFEKKELALQGKWVLWEHSQWTLSWRTDGASYFLASSDI